MLREIAIIIGLTLVPGLELRASIPYGILTTDLHWSTVLVVALITNILLGAVVYTLIGLLLDFCLKFSYFRRPWEWYTKKVQKKIHRNVEKYGEFGLALFIGVPLPGSGSISGAVAAHLMGMSFKRFFLANLIGVSIAAIVVLAVSLFGDGAWNIFIKV